MSSNIIKTHWSWNTEYSADSVEWCPISLHTHLFVCGTYQLLIGDENDSNKTKRLGRLYLFTTKETNPELLQTIETSAILDQKWSHYVIKDQILLATATAVGSVQIYKLDYEKLLLIDEKYVEGPNALVLSLDWSNNRIQGDNPKILVSDSIGNVSLFSFDNKLKFLKQWNAHAFEAWTTAFNTWNSYQFFTGGDDTLLKTFDTRMENNAASVNKTHEAGVTTILSSIHTENQILTGSYDEFIRVWDIRNIKSPLSNISVGGGVWRLKLHPNHKNLLLAACMYAGFRLLELNGNEIKLLEEYLEHTSIGYGADWNYSDENIMKMATCSFYDCKLNISHVLLE